MKPRALFAGLLLLAVANCSYGTEQTAESLANMMQQAQYSEGFEARMNVMVTQKNGARGIPFKIAVVGQLSADKQRVRVSGIAPESVRARIFAAERSGDGNFRAVTYRSAKDATKFEVNAKLFDSQLMLWDMFSPWWSWRSQAVLGNERLNGRECVNLRSVAEDKNLSIREVESCVDVQTKLALRTRFFDARHALVRTALVGQTLRKSQTDALAAKKLTLTDAAGTKTEIEVYAGDEQYQITPETFAALDAVPNETQGAK